MNNLQVFNFDKNVVRTMLINGNPYFVLKDVCEVLDLEQVSRVKSRLKEDGVTTSKVIDNLGREQVATVINESNLYKTIFQSRKVEAERFQDWVTEEVLPTIRKTGNFSMPQTYSDALRELAKQHDEKQLLLQENSNMKPKADFYDAVADSKTAIPMDQVAKVLDIKGIGRNRLFEILRNQRILMSNNVPYQTYVDRGYFRVVEQRYTKPNGETHISIRTLVYQKGVDYIRKIVETG